MKKLITILILLLVLVCGSLSFLYFQGFLKFDVKFPWQTEIESGGSYVLDSISHFQELTTAVYHFKSVFPYDFITEEDRIRLSGLYTIKEPLLSAHDFLLLDLQQICRNSGMDLRKKSGQFFLIKTMVQAGPDFTDWKADEMIVMTEEDGICTSLQITLPEPVILSLRHDDLVWDSEAAPDLALDPQTYSAILALLEEPILKKVKEEGILESARTKAEMLISNLLSDSPCGKTKIKFLNSSPD